MNNNKNLILSLLNLRIKTTKQIIILLINDILINDITHQRMMVINAFTLYYGVFNISVNTCTHVGLLGPCYKTGRS